MSEISIYDIPIETILRYLSGLVKWNSEYLFEMYGSYIAEKLLGVKFEKAPETLCDLVNYDEKICVEVKHVKYVTDNNIVFEVAYREDKRNQLAKYIVVRDRLGFKVYYLFIKDKNEYKLLTLEELLKLIRDHYGDEVINDIYEKVSRKLTPIKRSIELSEDEKKLVAELYRLGYSIKKIARILNISERQVRKVLYSCGLLQLSEDICPRCFCKMTKTNYGYICPSCRYKKYTI